MKFLILFCLLILTVCLSANPMLPRYISEVYMHDGQWSIEISPQVMNISPGDSVRIWCNAGVCVVPVTEYCEIGQCIVINSQQCSLAINPNEDLLSAGVYMQGSWWNLSDGFSFHSGYPNNTLPGQSLVMQKFYDDWGFSYAPCMEASPTLGSSPYQVVTYGTLTGYIRDSHSQPVTNAIIKKLYDSVAINAYTDENGFYIFPGLEGKTQYFQIIVGDSIYGTTSFNIIPTQTITHDFTLNDYTTNHDLTQNHILPVMVSPNPIRPGNEIKFDLGSLNICGLKLKIYNVKGESISEISTSQTSGVISLPLPSGIASGIYIFQIGNKERTYSTGKITVLK
jgi:hypothetical protein